MAAAVQILGGMDKPIMLSVEPVGRAHLLCCGVEEKVTVKAKAAAKKDGGKVAVGPSRRITEAELKKTNHYQILGLDKDGIGVDEDLIRRAYHKALLVYHPDKHQTEASREADDEGSDDDDDDDEGKNDGPKDVVFLAVQKAHLILSNQTSRRAFDSTNNFDDTIPTGNEARELGATFDFYKTYGPVFRSNARFADGDLKNKPVPDLGDETATEAEVDAFYEYWLKFESWRDFSLEEREHDPDAADDRYEKRWMEKENEKVAKKKKKEEYNRLMRLVDRARENDPRPKRFRQERLDAKERAKAEKEAAAQAERDAEEARLRAAREEAEKKEKEEKENAKDLKAARDKAKKAKRRVEKQIAAACAAGRDASVPEALDFTELETLYDKFNDIELADVAEKIDGVDAVAATKVLRNVLTAVSCDDPAERARLFGALPTPQKAPERKTVAVASPATASAKVNALTPWSDDELSTLAKAAKKFGAGARNRWDQVADHLNQTLKLPEPRSKEDCIAKFNECQANPTINAQKKAPATNGSTGVVAAGNWTEDQQKQLEAALTRHPAKLGKDERWRRVSADVQGKSKKDCAERYKQICEALKSKR